MPTWDPSGICLGFVWEFPPENPTKSHLLGFCLGMPKLIPSRWDLVGFLSGICVGMPKQNPSRWDLVGFSGGYSHTNPTWVPSGAPFTKPHWGPRGKPTWVPSGRLFSHTLFLILQSLCEKSYFVSMRKRRSFMFTFF